MLQLNQSARRCPSSLVRRLDECNEVRESGPLLFFYMSLFGTVLHRSFSLYGSFDTIKFRVDVNLFVSPKAWWEVLS